MARFVTFYSFKGGVGRSLALVNVAWALARRGRRVVALDLDLEAPSLDRFPGVWPDGMGEREGILDHAAAWAATGTCPPLSEGLSASQVSVNEGRLYLLPAGRRGPEYQARLEALDWRCLHPERGTLPFVQALKASLVDAVHPDYVLIDSRTGFSEAGGVSTHLMADEVVLAFNLTRACIQDTVAARAAILEGTRERPEKVRFLGVASPVPPGNPPPTEGRIEQASRLMADGDQPLEIVRIQYDPGMVLSDVLAVREPDRWPAADRYERISSLLMAHNPDDVASTLERALAIRDQGDWRRALEVLDQYVAAHPGQAHGHEARGTFLLRSGRAEEALSAYRTAFDAAPYLAHLPRQQALALAMLGRHPEAREALERARKMGDLGEGHVSARKTVEDRRPRVDGDRPSEGLERGRGNT